MNFEKFEQPYQKEQKTISPEKKEGKNWREMVGNTLRVLFYFPRTF